MSTSLFSEQDGRKESISDIRLLPNRSTPKHGESAGEAETHSTPSRLFCSSRTIIFAMAAGANGRRSLRERRTPCQNLSMQAASKEARAKTSPHKQ